MALSNGEKKEHGDNARKDLESILILCQASEHIRNYMSNFRIGKSGYANDSQFLAPFLISFQNGERWILYTTTSMRSDRIKGQQWDAANIKSIVPSVTKAFLCYPDGSESRDVRGFNSLAERFKTNADFSAIDDIMSFRQLKSLIINYDGRQRHSIGKQIETKTYIQKVAELNTARGKLIQEPSVCIEKNSEQTQTEIGRKLDAQGREFERMVADSMASSSNLRKWKNQTNTEIGLDYDIFTCIVNFLNLSPSEVVAFTGTAKKEDIGLLPSGGQPKTDVIITAYFSDNSFKNYTISCKRTGRKQVSVHQYSADKFSQVLNPDDDNLADLLSKFQEAGNLRDFGNDNVNKLDRALEPYRDKLFLWALGGIDGDGNPDTQWAEYLLVLDNESNELRMHSVYEYKDYLLKKGVHGMLGTPFQWTYASGQKGKSIQLKCAII